MQVKTAAPDQRIFTVSKDQFISDVAEACKAIGLPWRRKSKDGFTAHSLQRTRNTNAMRANVQQPVRMKITGHGTPEMDLHYSHEQDNDLRAAMEKINQFIKGGEILDGSPLLRAILEKLESISKSVDKSGSKRK